MASELEPQNLNRGELQKPQQAYPAVPPSSSQSPTEAPTEELYLHTIKNLVTEIARATQISDSAALGRINVSLDRHPQFKSERVRIPGKKGNPIIVFTQKQRGKIIEEATKERVKRQRRTPPHPRTPTVRPVRHADSPPPQNPAKTIQPPQAIFTAGDHPVETITQPVTVVPPKEKVKATGNNDAQDKGEPTQPNQRNMHERTVKEERREIAKKRFDRTDFGTKLLQACLSNLLSSLTNPDVKKSFPRDPEIFMSAYLPSDDLELKDILGNKTPKEFFGVLMAETISSLNEKVTSHSQLSEKEKRSLLLWNQLATESKQSPVLIISQHFRPDPVSK